MPYKTIWENNGAFTKWWGHSTSAELVEFLQRGQATPDFERIRYSIHDFSECESFSHDKCELEFVAALDGAGERTNPRIKIAVVAMRSDVIEMIHVYEQTMLSPYPLRIFSSVADARAWVE